MRFRFKWKKYYFYFFWRVEISAQFDIVGKFTAQLSTPPEIMASSDKVA
jgi:hypothetical protein